MPKRTLATILFVACPVWAAPEPGSPPSHMPGGAVVGDEEIVKEFKRYFRKYKDAPTRVEAVLALEGTESVKVVEVLVPVLRDRERVVVEAAERVLASFGTRPPVDHLLLELAESSDDAVRLGILRSLRQAGYANTREAVVPLLEDSSWELRHAALRALVASGGEGVDGILVAACEDREAAVRCAAIDGLAELRSELVLGPALSNLAHESWQVRSSSIQALGTVRSRDSIEPLIDRMDAEEGRLLQDIGAALGEITGRDYGERVEGWRKFWETYKDRYEIPSDEELARLREQQRLRREYYEPSDGAVAYHGVTTPSRSIVFVIDVSGSMEQEVVEKERFREGGYPSYRRIDIVKTELRRTVERLEPYVRFNILAFATEVDPWKKGLVGANVLNKSSAASWISRLESIGGASREDLARAGLVGAANLEAGKTNSYAALMESLGVEEGEELSEDYEVEVDTVFYLSDGRPSHGRFVDTDDILREVRAANALRKVVIHTIAIGEFQKEFMRDLAESNGGVFVDLGR